ncbi:MAG TPA: hypothetical protein VKU83_06400, partial [Puia sp.]|nr:hypothetical protein [Puia sp.]
MLKLPSALDRTPCRPFLTTMLTLPRGARDDESRTTPVIVLVWPKPVSVNNPARKKRMICRNL